jgi:HSP20 family protein
MQVRYENGWMSKGWPFSPVDGLFKEFKGVSAMRPPVDIVEDREAYHFYFEVPGLKSDSLDVRVDNGTLTVAAERKRPEWSKDSEIHVAERGYGRIRRAFELPDDASHDDIQASYREGVLELTVGKRPETKPVKIQIN